MSDAAVVAALRSRRLESLLGAPLDHLTGELVRGLVHAGAQEAFDLDFKASTYGRGDSDKRALGGDVAALANTAGGIIVIGIEEDEQARAAAAPGVEVTDAEVARIRQVIASLVSPLPVMDVLTVLDEPAELADSATMHEPARDVAGEQAGSHQTAAPPPPRGFIVIAVPRSPRAPHAVLINEALRYPKRNGATTYYLAEPEVAAAYRDRLTGAADQSSRIVAVEREAFERLDINGPPWVMISLVPDLLGDMAITRDVHRVFLQQITGVDATPVPSGVSFHRARVGRRRLLADATYSNSPLAEHVSLELHADGAGSFAITLPDLNERHHDEHLDNEADVVARWVDDESIVLGVLGGLLHLARHARDRAAAGGEAVVRAQLAPITPGRPLQIAHTRFHGLARTMGYPRAQPAEAAETVAALDELADPGPALITVASTLVDELAQAFGVPEMSQVNRAGKVRRAYWARNGWQQLLVNWAGEHGI